jgi:hypothetical protein
VARNVLWELNQLGERFFFRLTAAVMRNGTDFSVCYSVIIPELEYTILHLCLSRLECIVKLLEANGFKDKKYDVFIHRYFSFF